MPLSNISKCLLSPSRLVAHLNWRNPYKSTVLALDISRDTLGVALAQLPFQPQNDDEEEVEKLPEIHSLDPIPYYSKSPSSSSSLTNHLSRLILLENILHTINAIVQQERVQGFIVGWPLQPHAQPGFECGQTLHVLDYLANQTMYPPLIHKRRPLTLWDTRSLLSHHHPWEKEEEEDVWKRSHLYCHRTTPPHTSVSNVYSSKHGSMEPYRKSATQCATIILQQFITTFYSDTNKSRGEEDSWNHHLDKKKKSSRNVVESLDNGSYSQSLLM